MKEIQAGREDAALMFCVRSELGGHPGQRDEPAAYEHARGCAVRAVSRSTWPPGLRPQTRRPERQLSFFVDQCTWLRSCLETLHPLAVVWHLLELRHLLAAGWAYQALPEGWARLACPDGAKLAADCVPTGAVANRAWPLHADAAGLLHIYGGRTSSRTRGSAARQGTYKRPYAAVFATVDLSVTFWLLFQMRDVGEMEARRMKASWRRDG